MSDTVEFEWRRRYMIPPTDPRFLDATFEDILVDVWAHRHFDDPKLRDEVVADGFSDDLAEMEAEALARDAAREAEAKPDDDFEEV